MRELKLPLGLHEYWTDETALVLLDPNLIRRATPDHLEIFKSIVEIDPGVTSYNYDHR